MKRHRTIAAILVALLVIAGAGTASADEIHNPGSFDVFNSTGERSRLTTSTLVQIDEDTQEIQPGPTLVTDSVSISTSGGTIAQDGDISIPAGNFVVDGEPSFEFPSSAQMRPQAITLTGPATGNLDAKTGIATLTLPLSHAFDLGGGQVCSIVYSATLTTETSGSETGERYNVTTGRMRLVNGAFTLPAVAASGSCSGANASMLNTYFGLPRTPGRAVWDLVLRTDRVAQPAQIINPANTTINISHPNNALNPQTNFFRAGAPANQTAMNQSTTWTLPGSILNDGNFTIPDASIGDFGGEPSINGVNGGNRAQNISSRADATGYFNPRTGEMRVSLSLQHRITANPGFLTIGSWYCDVRYDVTLTTGTSGGLTGVPFNPATNRATLVANDYAVPGVFNPGQVDLLGDSAGCDTGRQNTVNGQLGLPAAAGSPNWTVTVNFNAPVPQAYPADLAIIQKSDSLAENNPWSTTLQVQNVGNVASTGPFTVTDTLPAGVTPTSASGTNWTCDIAGQTVTCTNPEPSLAVNAFLPDISIGTDAGAVWPSVTHTATVSAPANQDRNASNSTTTRVVPVLPPDLSIDKTHLGDLTVNRPDSYAISVSNIGGPTVATTTVVDTVPDELQITGASGPGWVCDVDDQVVTCTRAGSIGYNASAPPITVDVVPQGTNEDYDVANRVTVSTGAREVSLLNNSFNDITHVRHLDIGVTKVAVPAVFTVGQDARYDVTVTNHGTDTTYGPISVVDTLPPELTYTGASGAGWVCNVLPLFGQQLVACSRTAAIAAGDSAPPIEITVDVPQSAIGFVDNSATTSTIYDTNNANNSFTLETEVRPPLPDIDVDQFTDGDLVIGQTVQRRFNVSNDGTGPTLGPITLLHTVPTGLTLNTASGPGWSCSTQVVSGQTILTCTRAAVLARNASTSDISMNLSVGEAAYPSTQSKVSVATAQEPGDLKVDNTDTLSLPVLSNDLALTKTSSDFVLGGAGTYSIDIENVGDVPTSGVATVTDQLPVGIAYTGSSGAGWACNSITSGGRDTVTCTRGSGLVAGDSFPTLVLDVSIANGAWPSTTNTASVDTPRDMEAANDSDDVTTTVRAPDLAIGKVAGDLVVGQNGTFTINLNNAGNAPKPGTTTVVDLLPEGTSYVSSSGAGWTCNAVDVSGRDEVTCTNPDAVAAGASHTALVLTVAVDLDAHPTVDNTATVSTMHDLNDDNDSASVTKAVRAPDLKVTKSATGLFTTGYDAKFTIEVDNLGDAASSGTTTVEDQLPEGINYIGATGAGWTCNSVTTANQDTVTCTNNNVVAAGGSLADLVLDVDVVGDAGEYTNVAAVSGTDDPNLNNNIHMIDVTVHEALVDLDIEKTGTSQFVYDSDRTYTIQVTNVGRAENTGDITVTDELPAGLAFVDAAGTNWVCEDEVLEGVTTVTCVTSDVLTAEGGTANPITLTVHVGEDAVPEVANTATAATEGDPNSDNDSDTETRSVHAADLQITKTASAFNLGNNGTFTLAVQNIGNAATTAGATVTDELPEGLTYVSSSGAGWSCVVDEQLVTCDNIGTLNAGASYANLVITVSTAEAAHPGFTNEASVTGPSDIDTSNNTDDVEVSVTRPDLAVASDATADLVVASPATYAVAVTNVGDGATSGTITVVDELPTGLTYSSFSGAGWTCGAVGQTVTCTRPGPLAASAAAPGLGITVNVTGAAWPEAENTVTVDTAHDVNEDNDSSTTTEQIHSNDLEITKSHEGYFTEGEVEQYLIEVENVGTRATTGTITVVDTLPVGVHYLTSEGPWTCNMTIAGSQDKVTCTNAGPIAPGGMLSLTLNVAIDDDVAGDVTNIASVATTNDPNGANDVALDPTDLRAPGGDFVVDKSHVDPFLAERVEQYEYVVSNIATYASNGTVTLTDPLPDGVELDDVSGAGWTCAPEGTGFECTHPGPATAGGDLPTVTADVVASKDAADASPVDSTATVSNGGDPDDSNDTDTDATDVEYIDLILVKDVVGTPVPGTPVTYELGVENAGDHSTTNVVAVTDAIPAPLTDAVGTGDGWTCDTVAGVVTCTTAGLDAGETSTPITITADLPTGFFGDVDNEATVATDFDVDGSNDSNDASFTIDPVAPGAPSITGITPGDAELSVAFTPPSSDGGEAITNYEFSTDDGTTWTAVTPASTTSPIVIGGLTNGTTYDVRIRAVNSVGSGAASTKVQGTPEEPDTAPSEPQTVAAVGRNARAVVSWTAPASDGGSPVTGYTVTSNNGGGGCTTDGAGTSCVVTGLTNGTLYTFTVTATNDVGEGPGASADATPRKRPSAPLDVVGAARVKAARMTWVEPADLGGAPLIKYVAKCLSVDDAFPDRKAETTALTALVENMRAGEKYRCKVKAVNEAGSGPWSTAVVVIPKAP